MNAPWQGRLRLEFRAVGGRTVLARRDHAGPVLVQRPFYPGDGACHAYILHPPGGLARDDRLDTRVDVAAGGNVLLTTPSATKVYRSPVGSPVESRLVQSLTVADAASLEWLPQETILFGGSRYRAGLRIRLARRARFSGWEIFALGRPASGDAYGTGVLHAETRIDVHGAARLVDRQLWSRREQRDDEDVFTAAWGLDGRTVLATYYAYPADEDTLARARLLLGDCADAGATLLDDLLVARILADGVERTRAVLDRIWRGLRPIVNRLAPCAPRVWAT